MNVSNVLTKDYENKSNWTLGENKPNTNPISEKPKINVSSILTKDYENQPPWGSKSIQTQFAKRQEMNVNFFLTMDYANSFSRRPPESKSNQTQCRTAYLGVLLLISATQSLSVSCGGWPIATEPGPVTEATLPVRSGPPMRGLNHRAVYAVELSPKSRCVVPPRGRYIA